MEYCSYGSLHESVFRVPNDELTIWKIVKMLANALSHIHSKKIIHGDIKPQNILLSKEEDELVHVKLADFGSSWDKNLTEIDEYEAAFFRGTELYAPPEVYKNKTFDKSADIWSLGATISFVCNRGHLFNTKDDIMSWSGNDLPLYNLSKYSADLHFLVMAMLNPDPKRRPTAETIFLICLRQYPNML